MVHFGTNGLKLSGPARKDLIGYLVSLLVESYFCWSVAGETADMINDFINYVFCHVGFFFT